MGARKNESASLGVSFQQASLYKTSAERATHSVSRALPMTSSMSVASFASLSPREGGVGREPESTAVELRKVAIHLQCSLTLDLARNRNLLRQLASRIKIMIKIKKLANALNSMVVEPERGAGRNPNLLSPALSSLWGREGEEESRPYKVHGHDSRPIFGSFPFPRTNPPLHPSQGWNGSFARTTQLLSVERPAVCPWSS